MFLEINPAGQFLYIEHDTGQPIAAALARKPLKTRSNYMHSSTQNSRFAETVVIARSGRTSLRARCSTRTAAAKAD